MKKLILILTVLISFQSFSQGNVYYQAIGEAAKNKSNYDITVKDLYGNYSKYEVQVESYNNNQSYNNSNQNNFVDFGEIALSAARRATQLKNNSVNNEYSNRIAYLETELMAALRIIQQQQKLIESIVGTSRSTSSDRSAPTNNSRSTRTNPKPKPTSVYSLVDGSVHIWRPKNNNPDDYTKAQNDNLLITETPNVFGKTILKVEPGMSFEVIDDNRVKGSFIKIKSQGITGYININQFK